MESTVKFPVYGSYNFELFFNCKLFSYILRTKYYKLQSIESYSIYYEQVFICLQQSNFRIYIWLNFDEKSSIQGHLFQLILFEWIIDKRSVISTLPFVWSFITCTCGFFHWSLVTLTWSCIAVSTMTFFLPDFLLLMYDTSIMFSSSW